MKGLHSPFCPAPRSLSKHVRVGQGLPRRPQGPLARATGESDLGFPGPWFTDTRPKRRGVFLDYLLSSLFLFL